jgi:hypothetical protein
MRYIFKFVIILAALAFVFGCSSSDSGGGSPESNVISITGIVVDPPVEGSRLELREMGADAPANFCGVNRNTPCQAFTNNIGHFEFTADKTEDLSDYYIVTYGGVDTGYNTDLRGISFYSPLSLFNAGNDSVVVSPVTSLAASLILNESASVEEAVSKTESALGLAGVDIKANPMTNPSLIKASYLIVKAADLIYSEGAADPLAKIAKAVENTSPTSLTDTAFLNNLIITVSGISDTATAAAITDEIVAVDTLLNDSELDIPDPNALVQAILEQGSKRAFNEALKNTLLNFPSTTPADEYIARAAALYELLTDNIGGLLPSQFAADQLLRFIIRTDSFFGDYDNYIDPSFGTQLAALVPPAEPQKTEFVDLLKAIAGENLYFVSAAISEPLGDNNTKRVDYYFRSNADKNYTARKILNTVYDDAITDGIADDIIDSYSLHGFYRKAKEIADYYIASTLNIIAAYRSIGYWTAVYDKVTAKEYLDLGKARLDANYTAQVPAIYSNSTLMGNYVDAYLSYMRAYDRAEDHDNASAIRDFIVDDMLTNFTFSATSIRTRWTMLVTSVYNLIRELIANGELDYALTMTDYYVYLVKEKLPDGAQAAYKYSNHINQSVNAASFYRMVANDTNSDDIKAKIADIKTSIDGYITGTTNKTTQSNGFLLLGVFAGRLYWAGDESGADEMIAVLQASADANTPGSANETAFLNRLRQAYYERAIVMAETDGFAAARAWYNGKNPIAADYSNLWGSYGIIDAFTYYSDWDTGMGVQTHNHGRDDIAENAADYLSSVLDEAVEYFDNITLIEMNTAAIVANESSIYPEGSVYPLEAIITTNNHTSEGGYLAVAQIYALIGNYAQAKAALQKAEAYADNLTYAYPRGKFYSLLGYYYLTVADDPTASEAAYAKAAAELDNITGDDTKLNYNILLAHNTFYRATLTEDARKILINGYLQSAVTLADAVYPTAGIVDDVTAMSEISYFLTIAARYASVNNKEKILEVLEKAEVTADNVFDPDDNLAQRKAIYNAYAKLYSVDVAVRKAETIADPTDINDALKIIATSVAGTNDFPGTGSIAFSDTDKDGKPDFFVPWATAEQIAASGLELDDDIDGDGTPDTVDVTPFYAD